MKRITLTILMIGFTASAAFAQSSKDYSPKMPNYSGSEQFNSNKIDPIPTAPPPPPNPIPIDGGVGFLLAAGAGYGLKKIRESKKK